MGGYQSRQKTGSTSIHCQKREAKFSRKLAIESEKENDCCDIVAVIDDENKASSLATGHSPVAIYLQVFGQNFVHCFWHPTKAASLE